MASDFLRSFNHQADTNHWMYKAPQSGELEKWRARGRTLQSQAAPPTASAPPSASEPQGQARRELVETLNKQVKSTKGAADVSGGKDQPVNAPEANFGAYRGYGMAGGGGFGGGGGKPGGFGAGAPAPSGGGVGAGGPGIGAGGKAAVDAAPSSTAGITNGRAPDANGDGAVPGVPAGAPNAALGLEYREGRSSGVDTRKPQPAANDHAFRPNAFFEAPPADKLDVAAGDTFAKHGEVVAALRDVDSANPQDVKAEELKQRVATLGDAPAATQPVQAPPAADPGQPAATNPTAGRKIIRNGDMTFEVDGFDSAYVQITKIVQEEGGFVATTDSEKLANGKVKGTVTVRVPPERLDTLVLKLRGLGDLKSSKLAAQDITKQYTDLESQLKAARAMEERLLNVIKTGKGTIKELVEAEKQLGVYREKIEQIEGEVRYYNNLVSLSTLNITLIERDIRTAAMLSETEQVNMGVESQDVEKARASAIQAIEEAKGRIVESDLKKLEAGQFAAKVVADVPPDAAGPLIDRMKQIGTVARLEVSRRQSAPEGTVAPTPAQGGAAVRLERRDTRFLISLYNLANVAPRQTTNLNLAAEDVEAAYRTILDQVKGAGGRVVTSQLNRPRPDQTTGTITFEAPAEAADVLLGAVRATGEVTRLDVTQNPDAQNVTEAKRGFAVQVFSIASVAPRETTTLRLAARGVADAFNKLREAVRSAQGARILSSQLAEQDPANVTGTLDFEVRRADWAAVEAALREAGQVVSRNVTRSADTENTVDTKIRLQVVLADEAALQPRETVAVQLAVSDVPARYAKLLEAAGAAQARVLQSQLSEDQAQKNVTGTVAFDVRRENRPAMEAALNEAGDVVSRTVVRSTDTQNTLDDKVRLSLTLTDAAKLPPRETTTLGMESPDVEKAKEQVESLALGMGGRVVDSTLSREQDGRVIAKVVADVPLAKSLEMVRKTRDQGRVQFRRDAREEGVPQGSLARARVDVTIANEDLIVQNDKGLGSTIREGLRTSVTGLLWSLQLIVVGLLLVAPWALIVYAGWRLFRRARTRRQPPAAAPAT
jgi:glycine cleavage system regulatory protein